MPATLALPADATQQPDPTNPGQKRVFASLPATEQQRITGNVARMRTLHAPPEEIDDYLANHEHLAPVAPTAPPGPIRSFAAEGTAAAPDQAGRRAAMAAAPPILSSGLPREAEQGLTLGYGDEINAGARALVTKESYTDALANERGILHAYENAHPIVSTAAQLAGGAATGLGAARVLPAAANASRMVRLARVVGEGATAGAVAGSGTAEGDLSDRLEGAKRGAEFGAVAAPVVVGAAGAAKRIVGPILSRAIDASGVRAPATPVAPLLDDKAGVPLSLPQRAGRRVGVRSAQDRGDQVVLNTITKGGQSIDDLRAAATAASADKPIALADIGGEGAQQLVAGAKTNTAAAAATKVPRVIRARNAGQTARVASDLTATGEPPIDPFALAKQMADEKNSLADQQFSEARQHGAIDHPAINAVLQKPWFADAYKDAQKLAKLSGKKLPELTVPGEETPIVFQGVPLVDANGNPKTYTAEPTTRTVPTVEALDYVRKVIADKINKGFAQGGPQSAVAHELQGPQKELVSALREAVPIYGPALDNYSAASRMEEALQKGRAAVEQDPRQARLIHDELHTPEEQRIFRAGLQDAQMAQMAKANNAGAILPRNEGDVWRQGQFALGAKNEGSVAERLKRTGEERNLSNADARFLLGSNTAEKIGAKADIDAAGSDATVQRPTLNPAKLVYRALKPRLVNALNQVNAQTSDAVANRLLAGVDKNGGVDRASLLKALDELEALQKQGQLTKAKTRELLGLPAAEQAGRIVGPKK